MKGNLKTALLLGVLAGVLVGVGGLVGGTTGATFGLVFAVVMNFGAYWFSDKIALRMSRARPLSRDQAPELHAMVERLCASGGLPIPRIYLIPSEQPNAFATGRNPQNAAVAVTQGILRTLEPHELEGVLAHELAHVQNRDILISSVAATIAGAISWIAFMARWTALLGDERNPMRLVGSLVAAIVAPLAAVVIQLAISRSREFQADRGGGPHLRPARELGFGPPEDRGTGWASSLRGESCRRAAVHCQSPAGKPGWGPDGTYVFHPSSR